jgi:formate hydrogenlyase subunit 6/NADH:ubiquinone oxidoreductase subunit I/flavodoxin
MQVAVYYFSGTGNSLEVARVLAAHVGCTEVPIQEVIGGARIATQADAIGVVFPTYLAQLHGIPLLVEAFFRKLENPGSKYLFAVCTCGGYEIANAVPALRNLAKLVKSLGGRLSAEYSVRLPMNNLTYDHIPVPIERNTEAIIRSSGAAISDICNRVLKKRRCRHHLFRSLFNFLMTPLYATMRKACLASLKAAAKEPDDCNLSFRELMPLTDKSIRVDDNCDGCGICSRVCPARNILIVDEMPIWQHRCEMCFACDEWCPQNAIHHWSRADGAKYHHPAVGVKDMFRAPKGPGVTKSV